MSTLRQRYESHPYETSNVAHAHPARLAAAALVNGIEAPEPQRGRMLELGCGNGLHTLALAQYLPESRCIGVDFARPTVERGEQILRDADLRNAELICRSLEEPIEGEFDYIVAHGVFSWVPEPVRVALLDVCRKHLAPQGVAFISFNALPGWKTQQGLRELAFRTVGRPADAGGVERARRLFDALGQAWSGGLGLNTWHASARAAAAPNRRLLHDDLAEINAPYYLTDFVQLAKQHGLGYVCDAQWPLGAAPLLPPVIRQVIRDLALGEMEREQLADFVLMTSFHRVLLVRDDTQRSAKPLEGLLDRFLYSTALRPAQGSSTEYVLPSGLKFQLHEQTQRAIVAKLAEASPALCGIEELGTVVGDVAKVRAAMVPLVSGGLVWPAVKQGWPVTGEASDHPRVWPLLRALAKHESILITPSLEIAHLDDPTVGLIEKMDGQHSIAEISQQASFKPSERNLRELTKRLAKLGVLQP